MVLVRYGICSHCRSNSNRVVTSINSINMTALTPPNHLTSKPNTATALRTAETWARYQAEPKKDNGDCFMCDPEAIVVVREFDLWIIIENNYPYDVVAKTHHLLIPKRHFAFDDKRTFGEKYQLEAIKNILNNEGNYDCIMQNFTAGQSQPQHLHYHLLEWKRIDTI